MSDRIQQLIQALNLTPHPEGGYYAETHRATQTLETSRGIRNAGTCIYFLLPTGTFSAFHRVRGSDEIWHHYEGDPVELHTFTEDGKHECRVLGTDLDGGQRPQVVVPAGVLQAALPIGQQHALCGATVSPGFDFADFEMPSRAELLADYPSHAELIRALTRVDSA